MATSRTATSDNYTGGGQSLVFDLQLTKRRRPTNALSLWYDTEQLAPDYGEPILSPPLQPGGATFVLEFQGADGMADPANPSELIPDPSTETPWATGIDVADGKRYFRWRMLLVANLNSDTVPRIAKIQVPYSFR